MLNDGKPRIDLFSIDLEEISSDSLKEKVLDVRKMITQVIFNFLLLLADAFLVFFIKWGFPFHSL